MHRWLEPPGQIGIGVDLCSRPPFADQLRQLTEDVQLRSGDYHAGELGDEALPVLRRKEAEPGERVFEEGVGDFRVVGEDVAQRSGENDERRLAVCLPVCPAQPQVQLLTPPQNDVAGLQVLGDLAGMAQQLGEGPLITVTAAIMSEVVQKHSRVQLP